ncbi:MAG: RDD family protein [Acidimicrobiales bacterium]
MPATGRPRPRADPGRRRAEKAPTGAPRPATMRGVLTRRVPAAVVDLLLGTVPVAALAWVLRTRVPDGTGWAGTGLRWSGPDTALVAASGLLWLVVVLAVLPATTGGSTPGMRLTGLVVRSDQDTRADTLHHLIRTLVVPIDLLPVVVPGLFGLVSMVADADRRRIGDRVAGTMVVRAAPRSPRRAGATAPHRSPVHPGPGSTQPADNQQVMAALLAELQDPPPITLDVPAADDPGASFGDTAAPRPADRPTGQRDIRIRPPLPRSNRARSPQGDLPVSGRRPPSSSDDGPRRGSDPRPGPRPPRAVPPADWSPRNDPSPGRDGTGSAPSEPAQPVPPITTSSHLVKPGGERRLGAADQPARAQPPPDHRPRSPVQPTWDEATNAWVVRHPRTGRRYRHDRATNTWVPDG